MTNRRPKGTPTGGQFAPGARAEVDVDLDEKPVHTVRSGGAEEWRLNGRLHREDGPAVVGPGGYQEWRLNGQLDREDGPAVTYRDGTQMWYRNGELHRVDGPAVLLPSGTEEWRQHGQLHRLDGPAEVNPTTGHQAWYRNGRRVDPPATAQRR